MNPRVLILAIILGVLLWLLLVLSIAHQGFTAAPAVMVAEPDPWTTTTTITLPDPPTTQRPQVPRKRTTAPIERADVVAVIRDGFARFGPTVEDQAVRVSSCETGGTFNPAATNGAHAGLFQISATYHAQRIARLGFTWGQMFTAQPNVAVAADIYAESGWQPWTCRYAA